MKFNYRKIFSDKTVTTEPLINLHSNYYSLVNLLSKGQESSKAEEIKDEMSSFKFSSSVLDNELQWLYFYFKIERYLLIIDGKYIGTPQILRENLYDTSEDFRTSGAFSTLLGNAECQQLRTTQYFINYFIDALAQNPKINTKLSYLSNSALLKTETQIDINKVRFIHTSRKLTDIFSDVYNEAIANEDKHIVDNVYNRAISEFAKNLHGLDTISFLHDLNKFTPTQNTNIAEKIKSESVTRINKKDEVIDPPLTYSKNDISRSTILENLLDGFILIDCYGKILDYNSTARKIFGYPEHVFAQMRVRDLFHSDFANELVSDLEKKDFPRMYNVIGKRKEIELVTDSETKDFEISISNNYSSPVDTYTILLKDFSHKKETLKNLREAQVNAERSAQAKSTFLSNMSHEIRTPLNVILGLSDIIKNEPNVELETIRKNLDGIDFSAKNLLAIVNDILDFSKIEAGKLSIQSLDFNLKKIITGISSGFEIKAQEKGLQYFNKVNDHIPDVVIGDQYRLNQVLTNLIGNAIKFTKSGQVSLNVEALEETDSSVTIEFEVSDTGIGISEKQLKHIFDSFYQIEEPEQSNIQGTGLGLAITKQLIELLGGKLTAYSTTGKGSRFVFALNFKKSLIKGVDVQQIVMEHQDVKLEGLRVLVAEDNAMNQFYIKQLLNNLKIEAVIAENGQEAVDIYLEDTQKFDLILMDMHMPIMNGIEAIKHIRNSTKNKLNKVPIVICSADVFPDARKNAIKAGIDFYLTKPLSPEALKEMLFWLVNDNFVDKAITEVALQKSQNINIEHLLRTFDDDQEFIADLLGVFISETPEDYNSLKYCINKEYFPRAQEIAHKLKSSFMNLGMTSHGHHLQQIEKNIMSPEHHQVAIEHFEKFKKLYPKSLTEANLLLLDIKKKLTIAS